MADNTVFDSVFKTMLNKEPQLFVPFINEAFGRSYPLDEPVVPLSTEYETARGERFADSVFRLADRIYHVECQSTPDADMVVRMIEYDISIALSETIRTGRPYVMRFPESCVLYLRGADSASDDLAMQVIMPDGETFDYKVKVVNAQRYTSDEIFEKRLLLLLPYYLMRYEKELARIDEDDARAAMLVAECADLRNELELMTSESGDLVLYDSLIELIMRVSDYLLAAHEVLRKRVRSTMGGEVLELWHDRIERMQRENEALKAEAEQSRAEAEQSRAVAEHTAAQMAESLRASGVDEEAIRQALSAVNGGDTL